MTAMFHYNRLKHKNVVADYRQVIGNLTLLEINKSLIFSLLLHTAVKFSYIYVVL